MPVHYKDIRNKRQWRATIGLDESQFNDLSELLGKTYEDFHGTTISDEIKGYTNEAFFKTYKDILFFTLFSLKSDLTYDVLALCFNISRSVAFEKQATGVRLLQMTLQQNGHMPHRSFDNFADLQNKLDQYDELLIDATEQHRQRPENQEEQKDNYSGKKKRIR